MISSQFQKLGTCPFGLVPSSWVEPNFAGSDNSYEIPAWTANKIEKMETENYHCLLLFTLPRLIRVKGIRRALWAWCRTLSARLREPSGHEGRLESTWSYPNCTYSLSVIGWAKQISSSFCLGCFGIDMDLERRPLDTTAIIFESSFQRCMVRVLTPPRYSLMSAIV